MARAAAWQIEANKYHLRAEFQDNSPGAYGRALKNRWLDAICSHITSVSRRDWTLLEETIREEAPMFKDRKTFYKQRGGAANKARELGILDQLFPKTRNCKPKGFRTLERCIEISKNCKSLKELKDLNGGAYGSVVKGGWQRLIFPDIPVKVKWTKPKALEAAKSCRNKAEYNSKYPGAYNKAYSEGLLNELIFDESLQQQKIYVRARIRLDWVKSLA
ncbi:hypothetical protein [Rufibacter aurantiacus]|uniref:hypothetical protein n=1 Tax=Rufibacter aurantiacus TaxID=2817374 RepID=UPI001B30782C|nr:hypothetical protein [Rufibacter aurantiacus]